MGRVGNHMFWFFIAVVLEPGSCDVCQILCPHEYGADTLCTSLHGPSTSSTQDGFLPMLILYQI